jgi:hypothetical protein
MSESSLPANRFAALDSSGSLSSDGSENESRQSDALAEPSVDVIGVSNAQYGGSTVKRADPLLGSEWAHGAPDLGFSDADVEACLRVVNRLGNNINLFKLPNLKPLRAALHPLVIEQMKKYGVTPPAQESAQMKSKKRRRVARADRVKDLEVEYINQSQLRALRLKQLESLNHSQGAEVPRIPDGVAICGPERTATLLLLDAGKPNESSLSSSGPSQAPRILHNPLSCYICHKPFIELHFFYDQLCPDCAAFNFSKRDEMADMRGKVCIVTGARAKIGYRAALKLLRCGARVIATTRFPRNAAERYSAESDSSVWFHRLDVYGLDFRDIRSLELFCAYVLEKYDRLDAIVNNVISRLNIHESISLYNMLCCALCRRVRLCDVRRHTTAISLTRKRRPHRRVPKRHRCCFIRAYSSVPLVNRPALVCCGLALLQPLRLSVGSRLPARRL